MTTNSRSGFQNDMEAQHINGNVMEVTFNHSIRDNFPPTEGIVCVRTN